MEVYNFKSNNWSQERYNKNELWNSNGQYDPTGLLTNYKTNDAHAQMNMISPYLKNKKVGIDIGCRWGSFTVQMHKLGFEHVHMIEMRNLHYKGISYNVDMNRASLYPCAALDKTGYVSRGGKTITDVNKGDTPCIAIDDLNIENVDFIKIDVDGPDQLVLKGCLETIKKYKPVIYIERGIEQEAWEKRHGYDITLDLKNYKEVKGLENNYILGPVQN